jgi:murein peptide amidase A
VKRWRALAKAAGWRMREFAEADGFPVYVVESPRRAGVRLYLSAGIHGDEPAATEGLVTWAEKRWRALRRCELVVFPCLNPWGLQHNSRNDAHGRDLNRGYHRWDVPVIAAQKAILRERWFDAAVMLHEDFDAHGVYLYEIPGARPFWGEELLAAAAGAVPCEPRARVEGRKCRRGLIRTRVTPETLPEHPEAFFLRFGHTMRSLTFETPSEFSMTARVRAHAAVLDEVLRLARG